MNKLRITLIITLIIALVLLFSACTKETSDSKAEVVAGALNSSYLIGKESITLVNGVFEKPAAPGSAAMNKTQVWDQPVTGDLNADGKEDAAVCLINSSGGSGTFYYIAAAIKDVNTKSYKGTNAVLLGDRIRLSKISIENGIITVVYNTRKPGEAMSGAPTVIVSRDFLVDNGLIKELTSESATSKLSYTLIRTAHKNNSNVSLNNDFGPKPAS